MRSSVTLRQQERQAFSLHSFRSGGAVSRALAGDSLSTIMQRAYWKSPKTAWRYMRLMEVIAPGLEGTDKIEGVTEHLHSTFRRTHELAFCFAISMFHVSLELRKSYALALKMHTCALRLPLRTASRHEEFSLRREKIHLAALRNSGHFQPHAVVATGVLYIGTVVDFRLHTGGKLCAGNCGQCRGLTRGSS